MIEEYYIEDNFFYKRIERRNGSISTSRIPACGETVANAENYDRIWLQLSKKPDNKYYSRLNLVDLFCGTGPMSLGVVEAGRCLGIEIVPKLAIDLMEEAALNYKSNFPTSDVKIGDISSMINGVFGEPITPEEEALVKPLGKIDFLIAGPPCQGHSDLNNHTRRDDPRNQLILRVTRFAELTNPDYILIENVQGIRHDKHNILEVAKSQLSDLGYHLNENLLLASKFGVAQKRRRFILVASKKAIDFDVNQYIRSTTNSVMWAISDLANSYNDKDTFNSSAKHSKTNQSRIEYLFKHDLYELPNTLRPKCQQKEDNRYTSVYGRMYPYLPAPTITSGFGSIGQGRFCHPVCPRSLTPHEASRVQFIPDYFTFMQGLTRVELQTLIGNAVPPKLTYILALELLR